MRLWSITMESQQLSMTQSLLADQHAKHALEQQQLVHHVMFLPLILSMIQSLIPASLVVLLEHSPWIMFAIHAMIHALHVMTIKLITV